MGLFAAGLVVGLVVLDLVVDLMVLGLLEASQKAHFGRGLGD